MAKRWKNNPMPTGLARVCAGPQGSTLRDNGVDLAITAYNDGRLSDRAGWYWYSCQNKDLGITRKNTCYELVKTEVEAKIEARAYIVNCIKQHNKEK